MLHILHIEEATRYPVLALSSNQETKNERYELSKMIGKAKEANKDKKQMNNGMFFKSCSDRQTNVEELNR